MLALRYQLGIGSHVFRREWVEADEVPPRITRAMLELIITQWLHTIITLVIHTFITTTLVAPGLCRG